MSETANLSVDCETGSFALMGSGLDFISCLRMSSVGETTYTGSGDPPSAAPSCYTGFKLSETAEFKGKTFASETGNFDLTGSRLHSISCFGKSSAGSTTYSGHEDPPNAARPVYTSLKLSETVNLKDDNDTGSFELMGSNLESISCLGKSFTNVPPVVSPADAEASERLCQLAKIIGASMTFPGTLGLLGFVCG